MRNVWLIAEQISVCLICRWKYPPLLTAFATAVVKSVPLKIYCWDRFVFLVRLQSVEIYGSSAKEICLRFHKAYTGCNGIAFYSAPFAKTVWVFFSDGSESNIEFGKMFSIKYDCDNERVSNASETLLYFACNNLINAVFLKCCFNNKRGGKTNENHTACVWSLRNKVWLESNRGSGFVLEIEGVFFSHALVSQAIYCFTRF